MGAERLALAAVGALRRDSREQPRSDELILDSFLLRNGAAAKHRKPERRRGAGAENPVFVHGVP